MYKHTEVAESLGLSRQALDKYRKQLEATNGATELGQIVERSRFYTVADLEQLKTVLPATRQRKLTEFLLSRAPVNVEVVDDAPGLLTVTNGFQSSGELTFSSHDYGELTAHVLEEVGVSNQDTAQTMRNLFAALETSDKSVGAAIGAKRLQNILGTADSVVTQGISQYAQANGLGKPNPGNSGLESP